MQQPHVAPDPFALLMNPEGVVAAMRGSDRLSRLKSRICRPLDKPLIPRSASEAAVYDQAVDVGDVWPRLGAANC